MIQGVLWDVLYILILLIITMKTKIKLEVNKMHLCHETEDFVIVSKDLKS